MALGRKPGRLRSRSLVDAGSPAALELDIKRFEGQGSARRLMPGAEFTLIDHPLYGPNTSAWNYCSFLDGLFSIVNPAEYESDLEAWIGDTPIEEEDAFHVIARNGFGDLLLWGARSGYRYRIKPNHGSILQLDGDAGEIGARGADSAIGGFFSCKTPKYFDEKDESGKPLFVRAVAKLGALAADEVFAFEPALRLGGKASLAHLVRRNAHVQSSQLAQLGGLEVLDRVALARRAFG